MKKEYVRLKMDDINKMESILSAGHHVDAYHTPDGIVIFDVVRTAVKVPEWKLKDDTSES